MCKLKPADEYLKKFRFLHPLTDGELKNIINNTDIIDLEYLIELINYIRKDTIKVTVGQCAEMAEIKEIYDNPVNPSMGSYYGVDKQSILNVADKMIKEI